LLAKEATFNGKESVNDSGVELDPLGISIDKALDAVVSRRESRRTFLRNGAFAAVAGTFVTACKPASATERPVKAPAAKAAPAVAAAAFGTADVNASSIAAADAMDKMHEAGIKAFPAKSKGRGDQLLAPRMDGDVKVFDLTARRIQWETEPGKVTEAWAYNGMVPGPQIRVRVGDRVRVNIKNGLPESTSIHFHGVELPNSQDGVPFITQPPIKPGQSYTYEFSPPNHGSHMYHSHHNSTKQVSLGLLGAFIVEPRDKSSEPHSDVDCNLILNDGLNGFTINGKGFPATEPIVARLGQTVRIRFMNEGMMIHPMHLHGMHMTVIAKDGWPQPQPWRCDTLNVAPGERWDVLVKCNNPGTWAFHCHILAHAESERGMFGMVTALIVNA
jgi:FtsP/CotA-like multicopper oxidase with cupredoxin domain